MNLRLENIRLWLAPFTLSVDATLRGRVTAIFGDSGSGKTTLLEIIAGLRQPDAGGIMLDGESLANLAPEKRAIGYVPQEGALFPHMSVRQNLLYGTHAATISHNENQVLSFAHVTEVLEIAALTARAIATLSGGEKQRVALGRALLSRPRLLLLDEPLAGLDASLKERLLPYLKKIRDEFRIPMIYVTHSADEVMALCDEVLVLSRGQIMRHGAPREIFKASDAPRFVPRY